MTTLEWTLEFTAPAVDVWAVLADTDGFNRAAGLDFRFERDASGEMRGTSQIAGIRTSWTEHPITWQTPNHFTSERRYDSGPVSVAVAHCELAEHPSGTRVLYRVQLTPRNRLLQLPVDMIAKTLIRPGLYRALQAAGAAIRGEQPTFDPPPPLTPAQLQALEDGLGPIDPTMAGALRKRILYAPLAVQHRMRPLQIAAEEGLSPDDTVRECLLAVTSGALELEVQILCPRCRGAHHRSALVELERQGIHCPTCNVKYDSHLAENMEIVFGPAPEVRSDPVPVDCVFSPMRTPHILAQVLLRAGGVGRWEALLEPGGYRIETPGSEIWLIADPHCEEEEVFVDLSPAGFSPRGIRVRPGRVAFRVRSQLEQSVTVSLQTRWRPPHALTVAEMFALPGARDALPEGFTAGLDTRIEPGVALVMEGTPASVARALQLLESPITRVYGDVRALLVCPDTTVALQEAERLAAAHLTLAVGIARGAVVSLQRGGTTDWGGPAVEAAFRTMRSLGRPRIAVDPETLQDSEFQETLARFGSKIRVAARGELPALLAFSVWFDSTVPSASKAPTAPIKVEIELQPERIGRFDVLRELDRGGMGQVFEVVDPEGKRWALKRTLRPNVDAETTQLFHKEAYYASVLRHPNVVEVVDWGDDDGRPFLVMEVLVGHPLTTLLRKKRRLDFTEGGPILVGLLDALAAVHAAGLVHRDIKPANVFQVAPPTDVPNRVKLLDFGLMRRSGVVEDDGLAGTPDYMAPEQVMREEQDPRTDVYAVGALGFRMLSGQPAWRGETLGERVIKRVALDPATLAWEKLDPRVGPVLMKALQPRPDDRFPDAKAMRDAIASLL